MCSGIWRRAPASARGHAAGDAGREAADSIVENGPLVAEERYAVKDFVQGIGSFNSTRFW